MIMKFERGQMMGHVAEDRDFAEWYVEDFARKHLPDQYETVGPRAMKTMTVNGRRYARHFGFRDPEHQAHFVTLMWIVGPDFFTFPGFQEIAEDKGNPDEKARIDRFYKVSDIAGGTAIARANFEYWYPELVRNNVLKEPFDDTDVGRSE